jgi:hypothetical protein
MPKNITLRLWNRNVGRAFFISTLGKRHRRVVRHACVEGETDVPMLNGGSIVGAAGSFDHRGLIDVFKMNDPLVAEPKGIISEA